jgi:molecular chaperone DnaK (HSP70)
MARLGIDFGTTNSVVVTSDRGHYPVVHHTVETAVGPVLREVFPSLIVFDTEQRRFFYGLDAERLMARSLSESRYRPIRSLKRMIFDYYEGKRICRDIVPEGFDPADLLYGLALSLKHSLLKNNPIPDGEPMEAVITWPANASGAQRYLTRQCFKRAGFDVIDTINEPTASAIEFADRMAGGNRTEARKIAMSVAVFDIGGGTFDASLVRIRGTEFTVLATVGIEQLGGDDFDEALAGLFARKLGLDLDLLDPLTRYRLVTQSCSLKENISSGSLRHLTISPEDFGLKGETCTVSVEAFFRELTPLIQSAIEKLYGIVIGPAAEQAGISPDKLDAIYLVGGSSKLPLVPRKVGERFPDVRLIMTDKPFVATAMGAAIHSAEQMRLRDILARVFGVIRLTDEGAREFFDPIFPAGMELPARGAMPFERTIEYSPCHNIGHLRYLECSRVDPKGSPSGGVRQWSDVLFPYDPSIPVGTKLRPDQVTQGYDLLDQRIRETYSCDGDGVITVRITRLCDGATGIYEIYNR